MNSAKILFVLNIVIKILAVGLVVAAILFPDLPQFHGKAMEQRLLLYSAAALAIPFIWMVRFKTFPYPHLIDIIFITPFVIDNLGNVFNLYATFWWFDDVAHWNNWIFLTVAFGSAISKVRVNKKIIAALTLGFGALTHTLWEIGEYVVMLLGSEGLFLTYSDTMIDFITSGLGSVLGTILVVTIFWRAKLMPSTR